MHLIHFVSLIIYVKHLKYGILQNGKGNLNYFSAHKIPFVSVDVI